MQPYFIPYAGYFRLLTASDLFVLYDDVQFTRRGWVHRNKLIDQAGEARWLTLPLEKAPQEVAINNLRFPADAAEILEQRLIGFGWGGSGAAEPVMAVLRDVHGSPSEYLERLLASVAATCGLPWKVVRSSSLGLPEGLRGQDRILEVARRFGAARYVNAPGGRELYDEAHFDAAGIELRFLTDYSGPKVSILQRLLETTPDQLKREIEAETVLA